MLHGMLHRPSPEFARNVCVLLLSPGIKGRIGPHRLYLKLAERFASKGFHVLRFDFHGLGDSAGKVEHEVLADLYNSIQGGRYVHDTIDAMDWMQERNGVDRFVGSGLCGGSITALLAGAGDRRMIALLGIGLPVVLDGGEAHWGRFLTAHQKHLARQQLIQRLARPWTWAKFLSGRSNYTVIWRVIRQLLGLRDAQISAAASSKRAIDDTNPLVAPAFLTLLRSGRHALLAYSGADRLLSQFQEKLEGRHRAQLDTLASMYHVHVIDGANHILSDPNAVTDLQKGAESWLDEILPPTRKS